MGNFFTHMFRPPPLKTKERVVGGCVGLKLYGLDNKIENNRSMGKKRIVIILNINQGHKELEMQPL